jgi:transposase
VDECGLDESIQRNYALASIGQKILEDISGNRTARTSIIAGLNQNNILAPWYFSGYCNTEVVLTWIKNELLPTLRVGLTVIWDNATFHKSAQIKTLIESVGGKLIFLPPYSPDLNPIEHYWAKLKACIRRIKVGQMTIPETLTHIFHQVQ